MGRIVRPPPVIRDPRVVEEEARQRDDPLAKYPGEKLYDDPSFGGPYTAPLTQGQMDALQGFNRLMRPGQTYAQTGDLLNTINLGLTGGSQAPGTGVDVIDLSQYSTGPGGSQRGLEEALFNRDLDKRFANIREEYSGLGLGPGSTDRNQRLAEEAGAASAQFRLGQMDQTRNAAFQALPHLFQLENLPFERAVQGYSLNEAARQVADVDAQRRAAEFARTQGSAQRNVQGLLSGTPPQNTAIGPSPLSQVGQLAGPLAAILTK